MKKFIFVLVVAMGLSGSVTVFARDDEHLQDIKNWTPFFSEGKTLSYEHEDGDPLSVKTYKYEDAIGYEYFYVKVNLSLDKLDKFQEALKKDDAKKFENVKIGAMINWYRMDCQKEMIELITTYLYCILTIMILS